ncbi:purine-nucleoside phosphorylase [uncultured Campylobacter sp.]|uniref:purine-nucleoside phosphorylase n=1 Tax=uncultured Campylobacter sp. TaxID=218934 RepID=UPI0028E37880|nr:purine-nucleoside phosphorylase [uncultured Campylobacter sp.]
MIISAGRNEIFPFALPMGVGLVDMSINLTALLQKRAMVNGCGRYEQNLTANRQLDERLNLIDSPILQSTKSAQNPDKILNALPREIIFIGSAGLYKEGEIFEIYESSAAANIEISSLENKSYSPIEGEITSIVPRGTCKVNSSNFITTDQNLAHKLFDREYFLENMEFFAVLKVAQKFQIPAYGIFVATNFCDKNAHVDFIKNHEQAKKELENYLKQKEII